MSRFLDTFRSPAPLVGVIHLPPLPGYAASPGVEAVVGDALDDLRALVEGGVDAVLVENEHDRPHRVAAGRETIAVMTRVTRALVEAGAPVRIGVEILLNDPEASLAVASAAGAAFIRTDYFTDPMFRPEYGVMRIDPAGLIDYRRRIGAETVLILADIQVKYARMLEPRTLQTSARLAAAAGADALVVSGSRTGEAPSPADVSEAKLGAGPCPVMVGSGLAPDNAVGLLRVADGAIVGTSLQEAGRPRRERVRALVALSRQARERPTS